MACTLHWGAVDNLSNNLGERSNEEMIHNLDTNYAAKSVLMVLKEHHKCSKLLNTLKHLDNNITFT